MNASQDPTEVQIFTDGACSGNPGPGGWACILRHTQTGKEKELWGGEPNTTNNRMELRAVIEGLSALKRKTHVQVITDSQYVKNGITTWIHNWKKNNWQRKTKQGYQPVKNAELWKTLDQLVQKHDVNFAFVKGHSGHEENERCDELAVRACQEVRHQQTPPTA